MIGKKTMRISELEQLVEDLFIANEVMADIVRRCPPRTVAVGRERDAALRQHEHLKSKRLKMNGVTV